MEKLEAQKILEAAWLDPDPKRRRIMASVCAEFLGPGGLTEVMAICGLSSEAIRLGSQELIDLLTFKAPLEPKTEVSPEITLDDRLTRRFLANPRGLARTIDNDQSFWANFLDLIEREIQGPPNQPLLWTTKKEGFFQEELAKRGLNRSSIFDDNLRSRGYHTHFGHGLQMSRLEGLNMAEQFQRVNEHIQKAWAEGQPVLAIESLKTGQDRHLAKAPLDFSTVKDAPNERGEFAFPEEKDWPLGIYDLDFAVGLAIINQNQASPSFLKASIKGWWLKEGQRLFSGLRYLTMIIDRVEFDEAEEQSHLLAAQELANEIGAPIKIAHIPIGLFRWSQGVEHRLFSYFSNDWSGLFIANYEIIVSLLSRTRTSEGLKVNCQLNRQISGFRPITEAEFSEVSLKPLPPNESLNYLVKNKI